MIRITNIKTWMFLAVLFCSAGISHAQQDPNFTYYNFNTQTINPAYAGTWDNLGFMALGRLQWAGMEGAPQTYTLSIQSPISSGNVALGLNIVSDRAGFENRLAANADYSYRLKISENTSLRLGIKGGITSYSHNLTRYTGYPGDPQDPLFMSDINNKIMPNFGIGAFLSNENFYMGLSSPKILKNSFKNNFDNYSSWAELRHFYLIGGFVVNPASTVKFKPTFLVRYIQGASLVTDLTANFLLGDKVWLGANYRTGDSFGFIAQWILDGQLRLGYGIDFSTSPLRAFHSGTHEIMVSYELGMLRNWDTPRMF
jgi:type IX secretion system PorP/SprF family membrane protein